MKKVAIWGAAIAFVAFLITWGVMGLEIYSGNYDIQSLSYIGLACWIVLLICLIIIVINTRCPHCGKIRRTRGKYCPYCGKEI